VIDVRELTDRLSELLSIPWLKDIIKFTAPQQPDPGMPGGRGAGPTTREYVRKSAGGGQQGQNVQSQQAWAAMANGGGGTGR